MTRARDSARLGLDYRTDASAGPAASMPRRQSPCSVQEIAAAILPALCEDRELEQAGKQAQSGGRMLPMTLQFVIAMIATAINDRMQRRLTYLGEEVRVLQELLRTPPDETAAVYARGRAWAAN